MVYRLSGEVLDGSDPVSGQPVFVVDTADSDPSNWTIVATTESAADGSWSVTVAGSDPERYHAVTQVDDGSLKNAKSLPYLTAQPVASAAPVQSQLNVSSPANIGGAIPDSGLEHHYDFDAEFSGGETISSVTDRSGSDNLTATGDPQAVADTINGRTVARLDGTDDYFRGEFSSAISQPLQVFFVGQLRSTDASNNQGVIDGFNNRHLFYDDGSGDWRINYGASGVSDGTADANIHLFETDADSTDRFLLDGSSIMSGDAGNDDLDGLSLGILNDTSGFGPVDFGEIAVYDKTASGYSAGDVRSYFNDKWSVY